MPLLAKKCSNWHEDLKLAPPLDIHWVWHVHMLCPVQYNKDCTATVDRILGHQPSSLESMSKLMKSTRNNEWQEMYPDVPFEVGLSHLQTHPETLDKEKSTIEYNIELAASR